MGQNLELALNFAGMSACVAASVYLYFTGNKKVAAFLIIGFVLHLQSAVYLTFADQFGGSGECWADTSDFYSCLPFWQKISMHAAQVGHYFLAFGVFMLALSSHSSSGRAS
ncbi:hypothetical protein D3C78_1294050 [compost metagenome]